MRGYSFVPLVGLGPSRGIVSHGLMGGAEIESPLSIIVCLSGNVKVSVSYSGGVLISPIITGEVLGSPTLSGSVKSGNDAALSGSVLTSPSLTGRTPLDDTCD